MKSFTLFFGFILLLSLIGVNAVPKLKIGVKKRVECTNKTRRRDVVHVHYTAALEENGTVFESTYETNEPLKYTIGDFIVTVGMEQGLLGMCEGEKRRLIVPPELAYGEYGLEEKKIPPNAWLIYEIELLKVEKRTEL